MEHFAADGCRKIARSPIRSTGRKLVPKWRSGVRRNRPEKSTQPAVETRQIETEKTSSAEHVLPPACMCTDVQFGG